MFASNASRESPGFDRLAYEEDFSRRPSSNRPTENVNKFEREEIVSLVIGFPATDFYYID